MQKIKIQPSVSLNSVTYLTNEGYTRQYTGNPYSSTGCSGQSACDGYSAVAKCLIDIWQGVRVCQTIYLIDKNGELLDTDRLDYIDITIQNEYGCSVYWFSSRELEDYNPIEFLQRKVEGTMLEITPETLGDVLSKSVFDYTKGLVSATEDFVAMGSDDAVGEIITLPLEYNDSVWMTVVPHEDNEGRLVVKFNGTPNPVVFGQKTELVSLSDSGEATLDIMSCDANNNPNEVLFTQLKFDTTALVQNKGAVRICFEEYENAYMMPASVNALVTMKFRDDDPEESGSTYMISCVRIGTVRKNPNLDTSNETPLISSEVRPEWVGYDNTKSGLQSTNMRQAVCEVDVKLKNAKKDKRFTGHFECQYEEATDTYYWDVKHYLGVEGVEVTAKDDEGQDIEGNVVYISKNHLRIYFSECVNGTVYIN